MLGSVIIFGKAKAEIGIVPFQSGTLTYSGAAQSPVWNGFNSNAMEIGGKTSATNAGTYSATFTPKEGYVWSDGTTDMKTVQWTINRAAVSVPTAKAAQTYTGSELTAQWNGYDSGKMTISGTVKGTNAGTYNATFTPGANYQWPDGSTAAKTVSWSIAKAAGSLSINKTSMTLNLSSLTGTITVNRAGDGAVTASSSNTSIATVSVSGTAVTVTAKAKGSVTITINVAAGTNHTAPSSKTCAVTVELPSKTLADNTPADIQAAARAGTAPNYWSVGDKIGIELNGTVGALTLNDTYYAFIIGFNHNAEIEGDNSIHFQFGKTNDGTDIALCEAEYGSGCTDITKDPEKVRFTMNRSNTNYGGWKNSYMRKTICPEFLAIMPEEWRNVIEACTKYNDEDKNGDTVVTTLDQIWIPAGFEVFGTKASTWSSEHNYQEQYDYYKNGNSKVKYKHNEITTPCTWWLRSRKTGNDHEFCAVLQTGEKSNGSQAIFSNGFAPCFKVA